MTTPNANQICFGIEVETHISADDPTAVGPYHHGYQVPWLPTGWKAERDCSIVYRSGRKACEFVSPKLCGEDGLREVVSSVTKIAERGARVNSSCGVHVTVTFPRNNAPALVRLISLVAHYERGLYASTGTRNRENGGFAKSMHRHGAMKNGGNTPRTVEWIRHRRSITAGCCSVLMTGTSIVYVPTTAPSFGTSLQLPPIGAWLDSTRWNRRGPCTEVFWSSTTSFTSPPAVPRISTVASACTVWMSPPARSFTKVCRKVR